MSLIIKCSELAQLTSESRDRALNWRERALIRIHLVLCPPCVRFRRQMAFLAGAVKSRGAERAVPGATLDASARERIRRSLESKQR